MPTRQEQKEAERAKRVAAQEKVFDQEDIDKIAELVPGIIQEAKAGVKTTEFWLTTAIGVLVVLDGIPLPERFEGIVVAVLGGLYALSRGIAKKGIPHVEPTK